MVDFFVIMEIRHGRPPICLTGLGFGGDTGLTIAGEDPACGCMCQTKRYLTQAERERGSTRQVRRGTPPQSMCVLKSANIAVMHKS